MDSVALTLVMVVSNSRQDPAAISSMSLPGPAGLPSVQLSRQRTFSTTSIWHSWATHTLAEQSVERTLVSAPASQTPPFAGLPPSAGPAVSTIPTANESFE